MIQLFLGYDSRIPALSSVLAHSIHARASEPVNIALLSLAQLKNIFKRERNPLQSTEFSFSRFLAPYLCGYEGFSIFMDNDMIVLDDIAKLWALRDAHYAVQCVKHDHQAKEGTKFLIFNNAKCRALTPEYVNTASGLALHQFKWLESENHIGEIPHRWNHLVGYDAPNSDVSLVHYTLGGPFYTATHDCEYAAEWLREREDMLRCVQA